jgi:hypothetical protein
MRDKHQSTKFMIQFIEKIVLVIVFTMMSTLSFAQQEVPQNALFTVCELGNGFKVIIETSKRIPIKGVQGLSYKTTEVFEMSETPSEAMQKNPRKLYAWLKERANPKRAFILYINLDKLGYKDFVDFSGPTKTSILGITNALFQEAGDNLVKATLLTVTVEVANTSQHVKNMEMFGTAWNRKLHYALNAKDPKQVMEAFENIGNWLSDMQFVNKP